MNLMNFLKPDGQKIIITIFSYSVFYILDYLILGNAELFYSPTAVEQILAAPPSFWIARFIFEISAFYVIASFVYWFLNLRKSYKLQREVGNMTESFWTFLKPNKVNIMLMLAGYAMSYIFYTVFYGPINAFYFPPAESVQPNPVELNVITLLVDLLMFYLIGSFSYWLVEYFKGHPTNRK